MPKPGDVSKAPSRQFRKRSSFPAAEPKSAERQAPQRQRFLQMQTQLDEARSGLARHRNELDELRGQLSAKEAHIEAMLAELRENDSRVQIEARLLELDERGDAFAEELRRRLERAAEGRSELSAIDTRVRELEEGTEMSRVRMRLERVDHQLRGAIERIESVESRQRDVLARIEKQEANDRRIARLESLFSELASELGSERDGRDVDELRARLADVEALTVEAGTELKAQENRIRVLSDSIAPPPMQAAPSNASADDLTRIKGIGPKYARLLAEAGVGAISDIASWTDEEVEGFAAKLRIKPARIRKAGWVESARSLSAD